ncbi:MAG: hypothetical protein OEV73_02950 [Desulfobulbaceae bacterium]|nr:hypothetical protein [Desulfobulbaceae bacterium]
MGKISKLRLPAEPDKRPADEGVNAAELAVLTGEQEGRRPTKQARKRPARNKKRVTA